MDDETQKRLITLPSSAIACAPASRSAEELIKEPKFRGVGDNFKEALLKASFSLVSPLVASCLVQGVVGSRWSS